jgi:hypothetical protein
MYVSIGLDRIRYTQSQHILMLLTSCEFSQSQRNESRALCKDVNAFLSPCLSHLLSDLGVIRCKRDARLCWGLLSCVKIRAGKAALCLLA